MERCPNCDAATRPGAKFCTTCGYRITDSADATEDVAPDGGPTAGGDGADRVNDAWAAPIGAVAASTWTPPVDDALPAAAVAVDDGPIPAASDDPPAPPALAADDPAVGRDEPLPSIADAAIATTEITETAEAADQVLSSSWPVAMPPSWSAGWDAPPATTDADAASDPPETREIPSPGTDVARDDDRAAPLGSATPEDRVDTLAAADPPVDAPPADGADDTAAAGAPDAPPRLVGAVRGSRPSSDGDDPAARATALVEELRALLPALTAAPPVDLVAVAADLADALPTVPAAAAADRHLLRAVLRAARDRPRDVDTMMDLAVRADAFLALLDAHEGVLAAVDGALVALRPDPAA